MVPGFIDELVPRPPPLRDGVPLTLSYSDLTVLVPIDKPMDLLMTYDLCIIYIYIIIIILTDSKSPHLLRLWYILLIFDIWSHPIYSSLLGNGHPFLSPGDHRWPGCATCMHQQDSHLIAITQFSWTYGQSHGGTLNHPSHGWPFWYRNNHGDLG